MDEQRRSELLAEYRTAGDLARRVDQEELDDMAKALADQFAASYDAHPRRPRARLSGHVLTVEFLGGLSRFDEMLLAEQREEKVREFRVAFLEAVSGQLTEVIEALSGCGVEHFVASFDPTRELTECCFLLRRRESDLSEQRRALLNWSEQVRKNARELRERHVEAREAHARQRDLIHALREELHHD